MNKRLGALDAAFSNLDVDSKSREKDEPAPKKKDDVPQVLRQRNAIADSVSAGRVKSASQRLVLPEQCRMWRRHNRIYDLLTAENCRELIDDIRGKRAQHTPAIARPIKDDPDGFEYEVIAGARRHFAVSFLRENEGMTDLFYLVEVKRLTDAEAFLISDAENRGRKDISDYERAIDYASALDEFYNGSAKRMAEKVGMPRTSLRHYLNLANLPDEIVKAFFVPTDIALRSASKLMPFLNDDARRPQLLDKAVELASAQDKARSLGHTKAYDGPEVVRELLDAGKTTQRKTASGGKRIVEAEDGATLFEFERGRKYITVRIPVAQVKNGPEVTKVLKREMSKEK